MRSIHVVDIGANPVEGPPIYQPLLDAGLCTVTGFEPNLAALEKLNQSKGPNEVYFPLALGDGKEHTLNICAYSGWTSFFAPNPKALELFSGYKNNAKVLRQLAVQTHKLDDLGLDQVNYLHLDTQGSELMILQNARETLKNALLVHLEMPFVPLYIGQPSLGELDLELRFNGFLPHSIHSINKHREQLLEMDIVYVKDYINTVLADEQLERISLILNKCYKKKEAQNGSQNLLHAPSCWGQGC